MLQIECPWCGLRDETEYKYGGQAHVAYPEDPSALTDETPNTQSSTRTPFNTT